MQFEKRELAILAGMLGFSFIIRFALFPIQGYQNDMGTYISWFNTAADNGPRLFYSVVSWCDYPPFNVYLFWAFGSLAKALNLFGTSTVSYIVKLVPNIFDMLIGVLIFVFARKQLNFKLSLLAVGLYIFNPAIIFNAAVWGQFDSIYTLFLLLSLILALKNKPELSAVSCAIGILTKPQGIALLPLIAFVIFKKSGVKRFLISVAAFIATIFIVILPMQWSNPVTFLSNIYFGAYSGYTYISLNAFNFWSLFGFWINDANFFVAGWALFAAFTVFALYVLNKRWGKSDKQMLVFFVAFMMFFAFFMLPTRIHERYLFPAISVLALMFPFVKKTRLFYGAITATFLTNIAYVLYWLNLYASLGYTYSKDLAGDPVVYVVAAVNAVTFLYGILLLTDELKGRDALKAEQSATECQNVKGQTTSENQL